MQSEVGWGIKVCERNWEGMMVIGGGKTKLIEREEELERADWTTDRFCMRILQEESVKREERRQWEQSSTMKWREWQRKKIGGVWSEENKVGVVKWGRMKYGIEWCERRNEMSSCETIFMRIFFERVVT